MIRARVAPASARQFIGLLVLVAGIWLAGLLLAWGLTVAASGPGPASVGPAPRSGPSIEMAPQRWKLAPLNMA